MLLACSHLVVATENVPRLTRFFESVFQIAPYFENEEFSEFVLPSRFRIAFFKPLGTASKVFSTSGNHTVSGAGLTVKDVNAFYQALVPTLSQFGASVSGPPKDHPWGEKSFLLIDPDGNRWEITQAPANDGMLVNRK